MPSPPDPVGTIERERKMTDRRGRAARSDVAGARWRRFVARPLVLAGTVLAAGLLVVGPASAHVRVSGEGATQGGYGVITFRVPTESDTASTTEVTVTFPADTPITSVSTQPKDGWTATVTKQPLPAPQTDDDGNTITDYVSRVDFKATGAGIAPGEFDMFNLSVGPFPKTDSVTFAALQTYSDGTTVNWNEQSADGSTEPEHPAPVLAIAAAASPTTTSTAPTVSVAAASTDDNSGGSSWLGIAALVVAAVALVVAIVAVTRRGGGAAASGS